MYNFSPSSCLVFYKVNEEPDALNWLDFLHNQTTSLTTYAEAAFWFPAGLKGEYDHGMHHWQLIIGHHVYCGWLFIWQLKHYHYLLVLS